MSNLLVITFDNSEEAGKVRESLKKLEKQGLISLDDSAVIVKDAEGKAHIKNELDRGVKVGALGGGALGLLIGGLLFPVGGLLIGAGAGALLGALFDKGISHDFVKDVSNDLQPNTSAIFIIARQANASAALSVLRQYEGKVYQTTLDSEAEAQVREALQAQKPPATQA